MASVHVNFLLMHFKSNVPYPEVQDMVSAKMDLAKGPSTNNATKTWMDSHISSCTIINILRSHAILY